MEISSKPTFKEALNWASLFLEKENIVDVTSQLLMMRLFDWNLTDLVKHLNQQMSDGQVAYFCQSIKRFATDEPLAYILGYQDFMGLRFKVNASTLIPREETRGMVDLLTNFLPQDYAGRVLDIGTGSGIIGIMIKKLFPKTQVTAIDISSSALSVARENAKKHEVAIEFIVSDMFKVLDNSQKFDLILSNPPYISYEEMSFMDQSVLKYEPKQALFAEQNGLAYYIEISMQVNNFLDNNGCLLVEIGFQQGEAVKEIFSKALPNANILLHRDFNGHHRFIQVNL